MGGSAAGDVSSDLRLPLRDQDVVDSADGEGQQQPGACRAWALWFGQIAVDVLASVAVVYYLNYIAQGNLLGAFFAPLLAAMVLWRGWRYWAGRSWQGAEVPYSCGYISVSGRELYIVATVHISPRAPRDVKAVIDSVKPDVAMIELDEERLDRLRDDDLQKARQPKPEDLQQIKITVGIGSEPVVVLGQRALWNAERAGERVSGRMTFAPDNSYGLYPHGDRVSGRLALVYRGGPDGKRAPFAVKAHQAARSGAEAVLVINTEDRVPVNRLGSDSILGDLQVALRTRSCGFPRIPVVLLPSSEGERLRQQCEEGSEVQAEFEIMPDHYPRRTLPRRLCQGVALMFSGIGILYGIIGLFKVEVGAEFTEAEKTATARGIPCACIDVDMNRFWSRFGWSVLPTPRNLLSSLLSWLAFPRVVFRFLIPPRQNVDLVGSMLLHLSSLSVRTWIAFVIAGYGASTVATYTLQFFGSVSERGAEEAGVVSHEDRDVAQVYMMLLIEAYLLPQIVQAVASSRDEAMYRSIVAKGRELNARRLVAVVGGGHANGILQYARTYGL